MNSERQRDPRIVIVGAGMSGIAMGVALRAAGYENFEILEKGSDVGGVWHWNHYPGLSCDVPSQIYQYGFMPKPDWKRVFATGEEIQRYHSDVVDHFGLRQKIRLNCVVSGAHWIEGESPTWRIETADGDTLEADFVVMATGLLHHPKLPDIPGRDDFAGPALHSARWDDSVDANGKRVGVIGMGSTAVQIVSDYQPRATRVELFARTPQWVIWAPTGMRQPAFISRYLSKRPELQAKLYKWLQKQTNFFAELTTKPGWKRKSVQTLARLHLLTIRDKELRRKLTPDYEPLCKRQVVSGSFYRAVQRKNVDLVTDGIERIVPEGIVTDDGKLHELDMLVFATGFEAHNYMRPMDLTGRDGLTIDDAWSNGPRAYRMTMIPGFPNLFTMLGPNSPTGSISPQFAAELTAKWIVEWLDDFASSELNAVEVTESATAEFNAQVADALGPTVWNTGCNSWYLKDDGTIDLWPFDRRTMQSMFSARESEHFEIDRHPAEHPAETL